MRVLLPILLLLYCLPAAAQRCRFERSGGAETTTYAELISWYRMLDQRSPQLLLKTMGSTDSGEPLYLVLLDADGRFDPAGWRRAGKTVILVNNGIHPGEPDGIDASMMLARDIVTRKTALPRNLVLAIIPVYNTGGMLQRGTTWRANQNGPLEYGFRGNAQNLDLNRDFTKCDSREALSFTRLFHWLDPDILVDNHVSDGADYQHTFTLLTSQYDKLGSMGAWVRTVLEPELYRRMKERGHLICPYVNFETANPDQGMEMFYDPPRYSSGYAALFQTIGLVPETHMLKPFADRVKATYDFLQCLTEAAAAQGDSLLARRRAARSALAAQAVFPLSWKVDSTRWSMVAFAGYETGIRRSAVTGMDTRFYDRSRPYLRDIRFFHHFAPQQPVSRPRAYVVPQAWERVLERLRLNGVQLYRLPHDSLMQLEVTRIRDYRTYSRAYEGHYKHYGVQVARQTETLRILKGDYLVSTRQPAVRYLMEMLEPEGDDSFFAWNFFDAILQQKEGYSDHRWEEVAAKWLAEHPEARRRLEERKAADPAFAADAAAQLDFVYRLSPWYEPVHLRYPVFRVPE